MVNEKFGELVFLNLGKSLVNKFKSEGYVVTYNFNAGEKPEAYKEITPDIVAKKGNETIIVEVVTIDLMKQKETMDRLLSISKSVASEDENNIKFVLMVKQSELEKVKNIIQNNSMYVNNIFYL